jgi:predicted Zn-dependent protease
MSIKFIPYRMLVVLILTLAFPVISLTQASQFDNIDQSSSMMRIQNITGDEHDYFDASADEANRRLLRQVESFHLNKKFFENIGKGIYKYPLQDLDFILHYFPNHPTGLQLLTSVAVLSKDRALPIMYFEKALALYPSYALTYAQYGWYYVTIDRLDNGIQRLKDAVQKDPQLTAAYVWLAQAYEKKGDLQLAREAGARAKELGYNGKLPGDLR